jgi:F0F1-type ATP synthase delta subunit
MHENENVIAKKYAIAFLNLFGNYCSIEEMEKILILKDFFKKNNYFYVSLRISNIPIKKKEDVLNQIIKTYKINCPLQKLTNLLLKQKRIAILDTVLSCMWNEYKKIHNIKDFTISSSQHLSKENKRVAIELITNKFLKSIKKNHLITHFTINPSLIVGLRIESPTLLWERSIRKELKIVSKSIAKKGIPCE